MNAGSHWSHGRLVYALPLGVFALVVMHYALTSTLALSGFPLDDAWIHRVYARSFAFGDGFAYNPGDQQAGATSPLWVIITAPAHWFVFAGERAPVVVVKLIGLALTAGGIVVIVRLARHVTASPWAGSLAGCIVAADARLGFGALSGMETPLLVFLCLWVLKDVVEERPGRALIIAGLLPVTRPEAVLIAPLLVAWVLPDVGRRPDRLRIVGLAALPSLLWAGFCLLATGRLLPTTFYVKADVVGAGSLDALMEGLTQHGVVGSPLALVGLVAFAAALWRVRHGLGKLMGAGLLLAPLIFVVAVALSRDLELHGYYWTRYLDPGVALLAVGTALGIACLAAGRWKRWGQWLAAIVIAGSTPSVIASHVDSTARLASDSSAIERLNVAPARWIASHTRPEAVIGVNDAGASRYFSERTTVDLLGLNNARMAFDRPNPEELTSELDWLVVFPHIVDSGGLKQGFEHQKTFRVPQAEYTICNCPGQTEVRILRRADSPLVPRMLAKALSLARKGELTGAIAALDKALEVHAKDPELWQRRALLLQMGKRFEEAVADLERAVELSAGGPEALAQLGTLLARLGRTEAAKKALVRALQARDNPRIRAFLRELESK